MDTPVDPSHPSRSGACVVCGVCSGVGRLSGRCDECEGDYVRLAEAREAASVAALCLDDAAWRPARLPLPDPEWYVGSSDPARNWKPGAATVAPPVSRRRRAVAV